VVSALLTVATQYTDQARLRTATVVSDLPNSSPLVAFFKSLGYAIPHHTKQLLEKIGFGLGRNSMQGRETKHVKLAKYVQNTCNAKKRMRW